MGAEQQQQGADRDEESATQHGPRSLGEGECACGDDHERPPVVDRTARVERAGAVEQEQDPERNDGEPEQ